jgi:hypothetical protein
MPTKRMLVKTAALAAGVLIFATVPTRPNAQPDNPQSDAYLQTMKLMRNRFMNDVNDFEYVVKPLRGSEAKAALQIANEAEKAYLGLDATFSFLVLSDRMSCDQDRAVAKDILKNSLEKISQW